MMKRVGSSTISRGLTDPQHTIASDSISNTQVAFGWMTAAMAVNHPKADAAVLLLSCVWGSPR
jgi:hypothetical protein